MAFRNNLSLLLLTCSVLGAQSLPEDPVMKARAQRALAQGIREADLQPVPRSITEPPPLPPPEVHLKDTRGGRAALAKRKIKAKGTPVSRKVTAKAGAAKAKPAVVETKPAAVKGKAKTKPTVKPGKRARKSTRKAKS